MTAILPHSAIDRPQDRTVPLIMDPMNVLERRIRARRDTSDDEVLSDSGDSHFGSTAPTQSSEAESLSNDAENQDSEEEQDSDIKSNSSGSSPLTHDPSTLSFGALARAQAILGKRKRSTEKNPGIDSAKRARATEPKYPLEQSDGIYEKTSAHLSRTSKHAPQAISSKHAVTRNRTVIDVPKVTPRDPRFDPLTGPVDNNRIKQNYDFLSTYRTSEISQLKSAIRASKNADEREKLQKALKRMENRRQADDAREREQKVVREHRKEEKAKVKEGKKPFYLKEGEIKKRALIERFEGMGEKKRERVMEKRRKKRAGKEKKMMPDRRRSIKG